MSDCIQARHTDDILCQKLIKIHEILLQNPNQSMVRLNEGIAIDVPPHARFASFPYHDHTPYCQPLNRSELLKELGITEVPSDEEGRSNKKINESCDVSGSPSGVCIVTRSILLSNSHAGTHADQPAHFEREPPFVYFDDVQYNGPCLVIDLRNKMSDFAIKKEYLIELLSTSLYLSEPSNVLRLLFRTRKAPAEMSENWTNDFAFFEPECAQWLTNTFPNLLLIGIDTPSIDHCSASPIIDHSHGMFWKHRVAILENLNLDKLFDHNVDNNNEGEVKLEGNLQTIWNPMQQFHDAKGCFVRFFPRLNSQT